MTGFKLERFTLREKNIKDWGDGDVRHRNWPVVYVLNSDKEVYVGESLNAQGRMRQHLNSEQKKHLTAVRVVLDDTFNKSACLDLESYLIRMFSGDGKLKVLNSNAGITDADYFNRVTYQKTFDSIFEKLRTEENLFLRTVPEIVNRDLFKLSPFKALNTDQAVAVEDILSGLFEDLESGKPSMSVIQGNPGTGKTIVAIYLLKLLEDIRRHDPEEPFDSESLFSEFFTPGHAEALGSLKVGFVIPQQSLRSSVKKVFKATPGLSQHMVLNPFQVGNSSEKFDLIVVDEAHRLSQRAAQAAGPLNKQFADINKRLFGSDDYNITQLDWMRKQSKHVILMLDTGQSVRPADLPASITQGILKEAEVSERLYPLRTQMRVAAGTDYVEYARKLLSDELPSTLPDFGEYDLRFFDHLGDMRSELLAREREEGLARLVAGYAWEWVSKKDPTAYDIEIGGEKLQWNRTATDWINSEGSISEVGSIHTVQGYDLNYAGVIIGKDLRFDEASGQVVFDRKEYFDQRGSENNGMRKIKYTDEEILEYVRNVYTVLLTRGIKGTYVYVCDPALRERLRGFFPQR